MAQRFASILGVRFVNLLPHASNSYTQTRLLSQMRSLQISLLPYKPMTCIVCRRWMTRVPKKAQQPMKGGPVTWKAMTITFGVGVVLLAGMFYVKREKDIVLEKQRTRHLGRADIGGDWELVDHMGKLTSNKAFHGQWILLYFGFTHCPDVCPDELEKIVEVVNTVDADKDSPNVIPLFISVDPLRDTVKAVDEYIKEFSPKMIGLTGTEEQVAVAAKAFRVYFTMGPKDEDNDYIVDHSIVTYLLNPDGDFVDYYGQNQSVAQCVASISTHMLKYKMANK